MNPLFFLLIFNFYFLSGNATLKLINTKFTIRQKKEHFDLLSSNKFFIDS